MKQKRRVMLRSHWQTKPSGTSSPVGVLQVRGREGLRLGRRGVPAEKGGGPCQDLLPPLLGLVDPQQGRQ